MAGTTRYVTRAAFVAVPVDLTRRGAVTAAAALALLALVVHVAGRLRAAAAVIDDARTLVLAPRQVVTLPADAIPAPRAAAFRFAPREDLVAAG